MITVLDSGEKIAETAQTAHRAAGKPATLLLPEAPDAGKMWEQKGFHPSPLLSIAEYRVKKTRSKRPTRTQG